MPSSWPIVITPVPPTPATTMPRAPQQRSAGSGKGGSVNGFGRVAILPSL